MILRFLYHQPIDHHRNSGDTYYLPGKWGITGRIWIFEKDAITDNHTAELRFGDHGGMHGRVLVR